MLPGPFFPEHNFRRWAKLTSIFLIISFHLEQQAWFQVCVVPMGPITFCFIIPLTWCHRRCITSSWSLSTKFVVIIINILTPSWISIEFMMRNTMPSMICVVIDHFNASPPTQTCSCFVLYLEILATQLMLCSTLEYCYLLSRMSWGIHHP